MADLFKKFKKEIDKGVAAVSIKSSIVLETNKIRVHIRTLTEKIEQSKRDLGHMVYRMYLNEAFNKDEYMKACEAIIQLENQCKVQEEMIEKIKEQEAEILGKDTKVRVCECGTALEEEMVFCSACGKKVQ